MILVLAIQYDAWRQRQRVATPAGAPVPPVLASVPATPAAQGDWHTSAAYQALAQAFE